jgi:hypothetical protein
MRDLLHVLGGKPLIPGVEKRLENVVGCSPTLIHTRGGLHVLNTFMKTGLPTEIPTLAVDAIFRSVQRLTNRWRQFRPILGSSYNRGHTVKNNIGGPPAST